MNKSLRYIAILAILPLFTAGLTTDYFTDANAIKGQGVGISKYGSQTDVCGLQLCSDIPGGKAAWMEQQKMPTPVAPVTEEETMMEETMMEETAEPQTHNVEVPVGTYAPGCENTNSCFSPADITINAGDTIEWNNVDTSIHTATSGSPSEGPSGVFNSELIGIGESYAFTFEEAGSYDYFCLLHPWMAGSVTVN